MTGPAQEQGSTCIALGLFDGIHIGHRVVLDTMRDIAKERGLVPSVFTFDLGAGFPAGKQGMTRLLSEEATTGLLAEMGVKNLICPPFSALRSNSPEAFADLLANWMGAGAVVCGYDFHFGKNAAGTAEHLGRLGEKRGFAVRVVEPVCLDGEAVSSRAIRALIEQGEMPRAAKMLGRLFSIDFEVTGGRKLGRTLGWPTINQIFPDGFTTPRFGVYATVTAVEGKLLPSVTNVGVKPTVGSDRSLAETYIEGFSGDLYHRRVEVRFLRFLRPEQRFESLDALKTQISADAAQAVTIAEESIAREEKHA